MATTAPPTWQMRIGGLGNWSDFDAVTSGAFETAFLTASLHNPQITGSLTGTPVTKDFNVTKMEWGGVPIRRTARHTVPTCVEFWDDDAWEPFDAYAQCLLGTAMAIGREHVSIHVGPTSYNICLAANNCMQTNRASGRSRPLRINGSIAAVQGDSEEDDDEEEEEEEEIADDPSMPNEYRCPITQMPMKKPVMMCDGHTYECRAIQKWLMKKQTSPVTGYALKNTTMTVNHALRKLIRDWSPKTAVAPVSSSVATARLVAAIAAGKGATTQKRSHAAMEEDLFGSDSDDDDAPQTTTSKETAQTTMSDAGPSSVSAPAPKRMKKAMKPARM